LYELFNSCTSIEKGKFPNALKIAEVIPLFKKDDSKQTTNCRPISLLSQLIYSHLYSYLGKYNLLSNHQYGFRKKLIHISHNLQHLWPINQKRW